MPTAEPLNIKLAGSRFEPTDAAWAHATEAQRLDYWRHLGEIALDVKRREIRRGIGIDGRKLLPVKPTSRPDGAKGPPLIPHYAESRTAALLASKPTSRGVTLYWKGHGRKSWAKILGYHAYKHGPRSLPVRNTIGVSPAGLKRIARDARDWWDLTRKREVAAPRLAAKQAAAPRPITPPTRVEYLGRGQRPNPLSKKIQVYQTGGGKPPAPPKTPKPKPKPKPTPAPVPPPAPLSPTDAAIAYAARMGVKVEAKGYAGIRAAVGDEADQLPAVYRFNDKTVLINERHPYWSDPASLMGPASAQRWMSSGADDHIIVHEVGHALHNRAVGDATYLKIRNLKFTPEQARLVNREVSEYGATKPVEFVAETYAALQSGAAFPEDVMRLYRKLGGPKGDRLSALPDLQAPAAQGRRRGEDVLRRVPGRDTAANPPGQARPPEALPGGQRDPLRAEDTGPVLPGRPIAERIAADTASQERVKRLQEIGSDYRRLRGAKAAAEAELEAATAAHQALRAGPEKRAALKAKKEAEARLDQADRDFFREEREVRERAKDVLESPGRMDVGIYPARAAALSPQRYESASEGLRWLQRNMAHPEGNSDALMVNVLHCPPGMGERSACGPNFMWLGQGAGPETLVHEMGHHFDHHVPGFHEAARAFLKHRVGEEPNRPLREVMSEGGRFDADEMGRKDRFTEAFGEAGWYVGKEYPSGFTEITSMGLERMYRNPVAFAIDDPEYAQFMFGVMHGRLR